MGLGGRVGRATELEAFGASSGRVWPVVCDDSCSHEPRHPNCVSPLLLWLHVVSAEVGNNFVEKIWRMGKERHPGKRVQGEAGESPGF